MDCLSSKILFINTLKRTIQEFLKMPSIFTATSMVMQTYVQALVVVMPWRRQRHHCASPSTLCYAFNARFDCKLKSSIQEFFKVLSVFTATSIVMQTYVQALVVVMPCRRQRHTCASPSILHYAFQFALWVHNHSRHRILRRTLLPPAVCI